jgi:3-deoxy-D-manno-octulosonic-acid transferase
LGKIFYNLFLLLYSIGIRLACIWNPKAKKWLLGRQNNFEEIRSKLGPSNTKRIWMHCASLGEFEQGRPVLDRLKQRNKEFQVVLTFFSPSGYEAVKAYEGADHIFYLPMDSYFAAKKFIDLVNPALVLWVKYEYWFYYLNELRKRKIPILLVSGIFRINQPFFKWYGAIWKEMLGSFTHLFVQNESSKNLLAGIGITNEVTISGDTRFDRVIEIARQSLNLPIISSFCKGKKLIVAGSTWEDDEVILAAYADSTGHKEKIIVVPHELDEAHIHSLTTLFKRSIRYTEIENKPALINNLDDYNTLIVDSMGILSRLYCFGYVNYVGGGFTADGIHNILEAAVWGKPIIIGENYEKYFEAVDLVNAYAAESISNTGELIEVMSSLIKDTSAYDEAAAAAKEYVYKNGGATEKILEYIYVNRLLTN